MKERPIIMSADSVRAILDGRKTQTRRVVKPQPEPLLGDPSTVVWPHHHNRSVYGSNAAIAIFMARHSPYPIGSRLWVRETWCPYADDMTREYCQTHDPEWGEPIKPAVYSADYDVDCNPLDVGGCEKWRSPIYMPRWVSRITLEVTGVRTERVQDITYDDILAEGWNSRTSEPITDGTAGEDARAWYIALWDSINGKRYPWASNPWVWVVEFAVAGGDR